MMENKTKIDLKNKSIFMNNLQSVSIVAAFPIGAVIVMIAISFMKDAKKYMKNLEKSAKEKCEN